MRREARFRRGRAWLASSGLRTRSRHRRDGFCRIGNRARASCCGLFRSGAVPRFDFTGESGGARYRDCRWRRVRRGCGRERAHRSAFPRSCGCRLSAMGARSRGDHAHQRGGHADGHGRGIARWCRAHRPYQQRGHAGAARKRRRRRRDGPTRGIGSDRRVQAKQGRCRAIGRVDGRKRRAAGNHRQSVDADRPARHPADADRSDHCPGRVRPHARLRRQRPQPRSRGRRGHGSRLGACARPDRRALHSRRRERAAGDDVVRYRVAGRAAASAAEAAARPAVPPCARRRNDRDDDRARAFSDRRRIAHVRASNVFHQREGRARARLSRPALPRGSARRRRLVSRGRLPLMTALAAAATVLAFLACAVWVYLLAARGGFWRAAQRDDTAVNAPLEPVAWPDVAVVMPARNEEELIGMSVASLLRQDYRGKLSLIVVDDQSSDRTAVEATEAAKEAKATEAPGPPRTLTVLTAPPLPAGWAGKMWAVSHGVSHSSAMPQPPDYLLLTDADICHAPDTLTALVRRALGERTVLTSLMAKLRCESLAERAMVPAFIFFFQMLYPFAWVNRADRSVAAAAGGCMLVHRRTLLSAGGIEAIRGER